MSLANKPEQLASPQHGFCALEMLEGLCAQAQGHAAGGPGAVQGALLQAGGLLATEKQDMGSAPLEVASAVLGLVAAFRALGKTRCNLPGVKNKAPSGASL